MMNREDVMNAVKDGKRVIIMLNKAEVKSVKTDWKVCTRTTRPIANASSGFYNDLKPQYGHTAQLFKIVVVDPMFGAVFFSGFSEKLGSIEPGSMISLKVTVTGVGDATEKFPDPMLFAKPSLKKGDPFVLDLPIDATKMDSELPINV